MPRTREKKPTVVRPSPDTWLGRKAVVQDATGPTREEAEWVGLLEIAERARAEADHAIELLERVQAVSDVALAHLTLDELLPELLRRIRTLLSVDAATVLFVEDDGWSLRVKAVDGLPDATVRIPIGQGFAGRVAADRAPIVIEDVDQAELLNPGLRQAGIRSLLGVPLVIDGHLLGVLHVGSRQPQHFTQDDTRVVQLIAERVALATHRSRLYGAERQARVEADAALRARAEAERMKDDLANMIVHDLKNPVNGIAMMVQLALRKGGADMCEMQRNYLLQIDRSGREMMRLLLNLLEIGKIESGTMPVAHEPILLAAVAEEVAEEYAAVAEQTGRRLVVVVDHGLPPAIGDRALFKRVLINLVMNALRHSGSEEVRVDGMHDSAAARLVLWVSDHGRGIASEDQARVFEKFASIRSGHDREPTRDTGLGLPFCKLATERMGGEISLKSHPETGTVFTVTLPSRSLN